MAGKKSARKLTVRDQLGPVMVPFGRVNDGDQSGGDDVGDCVVGWPKLAPEGSGLKTSKCHQR